MHNNFFFFPKLNIAVSTMNHSEIHSSCQKIKTSVFLHPPCEPTSPTFPTTFSLLPPSPSLSMTLYKDPNTDEFYSQEKSYLLVFRIQNH